MTLNLCNCYNVTHTQEYTDGLVHYSGAASGIPSTYLRKPSAICPMPPQNDADVARSESNVLQGCDNLIESTYHKAMPMRPYVICHMCTTVDGKILVDRWGPLPGGQNGGALFEKTAASFAIDAWIVGTHTMKEFAAKPRRLERAKHRVPAGDYTGDAKAKRFAIGADAKGVLRFSKNEVDGDHTVVLVTTLAPNNYLMHLRASKVSYLICGRDRLDLGLALAKLRANFGIRRLMLEGGGTFNGAMLKAGLVDEFSQVIVPVVDGGGDVTSVFEIPGSKSKKAAASLKTTKHRVLPGGIHWLRYRVVRRSPGRG